MRRTTRLATFIFTSMLALPVLWLIAYDVLVFQPRTTGITSLLDKASPDERQPSVELCRLIEIATGGRTASVAARMLVQELDVRHQAKGMAGWHTTNVLWWALVATHLSKEEQITIIISRSYMGNGRFGFSSEAIARFSRPLSTLDQNELATLVTLSQSPSLYTSSPERLLAQRDRLVSNLMNF